MWFAAKALESFKSVFTPIDFSSVPSLRVVESTEASVNNVLNQSVIKSDQVISSDTELSLDEFVAKYPVWTTHKYLTYSKRTGKKVKYDYTINSIIWWMVSWIAINNDTWRKILIRGSYKTIASRIVDEKSNVLKFSAKQKKAKSVSNVDTQVLDDVIAQNDTKIFYRIRNAFKDFSDSEAKALIKKPNEIFLFIEGLISKLTWPMNSTISWKVDYLDVRDIHLSFRDLYKRVISLKWEMWRIALSQFYTRYYDYLISRKEFLNEYIEFSKKENVIANVPFLVKKHRESMQRVDLSDEPILTWIVTRLNTRIHRRYDTDFDESIVAEA